jgi:hypothetical protein
MEFNIIATVGTSEVDLAPYPNGSSTVPNGKTRTVYSAVLTNTSTGANTITLEIYKGTSMETSFDINVPASGTLSIANSGKPIIVIPSGRTFKAVASAESVKVLMVGEDK